MDLLGANIYMSSILLITSVPIFWIGFFFMMQPPVLHNKLRSIMTHMFLAWGAHFSLVGLELLFEVICGRPLFSLAILRIISAFLILLEFAALLRLYCYIRFDHD